MSDDGTIRVASGGRTPLLGLRVLVEAGPDEGTTVSTETASLRIGTATGNDLVLSDPTVSRFHAEISRREDRLLITDLGSTNGIGLGTATLVDGSACIEPGCVLRLGETSVEVHDGEVVMVESGRERFGELRARDADMRRLMDTAAQVARSDVPVMILGESGTGKELLARALHDHSERANKPFVTLDCGAISPNLFASELLGHEKGAFTNADRTHVGAYERAHGGTLFLDEVGELPLELQPALLGVLERGRFRRVGGTAETSADVRVISATNRDLLGEVNSGRFRLDLFYRLGVVQLTIPPLRERHADIAPLIEVFLEQAGERRAFADLFPADVLRALKKHAWPGNVRELRNVVLGTVAMGKAPALRSASGAAGDDPISAVMDQPYRIARRELLDEFERRYLKLALERAGGNVSKTARDARMDRSYLIELMKRHGLH